MRIHRRLVPRVGPRVRRQRGKWYSCFPRSGPNLHEFFLRSVSDSFPEVPWEILFHSFYGEYCLFIGLPTGMKVSLVV